MTLLKKNENSQILNFVKSPKIRNSRKFKHTKITRYTVLACMEPDSFMLDAARLPRPLVAFNNVGSLREWVVTSHIHSHKSITHSLTPSLIGRGP